MLLVLAALPATAQELRGRVAGTVTDNSGAVLPGATVTASGPALIQPQTTTSATHGIYPFPALPSGLATHTSDASASRTLKREGSNVTEATTVNAGYFDFGSFEEFPLGGAGNISEQAGPGALLNITVKSGGDRFHGTAYFDYEDRGTISDNVPAALKTPAAVTDGGFRAPSIRDPVSGQQVGLSRGNPITKQYDLNVGVGGPIVKGKVWFYAGYRDNNQ